MTRRVPLRLDALIAQAVQGLLAHRLRATLSSIGIVFGVATVLAALAVGQGARREAVAQVGSLGIDNILVRAVRQPSAAGRTAGAPVLSVSDAAHLRASVPGLVAVSAIRTARETVTAAPRRRQVRLVGATVEWASVSGLRLSRGRWLTADDLRTRRRVTVLGDDLARELFGSRPAVAAWLRAGNDWYQVVGVLAAEDAAPRTRSPIQQLDPATAAIVPLTAMDASLGEGDALDRVEEIVLRATGAEAVEPSAAVVRRTLERQHPRQQTAYEVVVPRQLLRARLRALRSFNAVLLGVGGLALLISGVGIMNIMLASVVERTAEIGVRRAFGATRSAVIAQFAIEAGLVCLGGGVAGVVVGTMLAGLIVAAAGWPVSIAPAAVVVALAAALVVGLAFGIYPARLAARLDPAEALRAP